MKPRDRLVVCVLVAAAGLAGFWLAIVSPKRQDATQLGSSLTAAQVRLGAAQAQLSSARTAEAGYADNLRVVKSLYRAVPANDGVPHLLVSLDRTSHYKRVDFKVISVAAAAAGGAAPGAGAPAGGAAGAAALASGLSPTSFTFTFTGGYIDLQHFLRSIAGYTLLKGNRVVAHGRLLTIQSVGLTPGTAALGAATAVPGGTQAAVTATAYSQQPATNVTAPAGATATASAPAGTATNPASASAPAGTATNPATAVAVSTNTTR